MKKSAFTVFLIIIFAFNSVLLAASEKRTYIGTDTSLTLTDELSNELDDAHEELLDLADAVMEAEANETSNASATNLNNYVDEDANMNNEVCSITNKEREALLNFAKDNSKTIEMKDILDVVGTDVEIENHEKSGSSNKSEPKMHVISHDHIPTGSKYKMKE